MDDNPYESPHTANVARERSQLSDDAKEFLGISREDFWYYPGLVLLVGGCFLSNVWIVGAMFLASTVFLVVFLAKSFPKYLRSKQLGAGTRVYGLLGNIALIVIQIGGDSGEAVVCDGIVITAPRIAPITSAPFAATKDPQRLPLGVFRITGHETQAPTPRYAAILLQPL